MHRFYSIQRPDRELAPQQVAHDSSRRSLDVQASTANLQREVKADEKALEEQQKREVLRQRYGNITKEKLEKIHDQYRDQILDRLAEGAHPSTIGISDDGVAAVLEENMQECIKLGAKDIQEAEQSLASSESFRKRGRKSLHYMIKRAFNDKDLDDLTNIAIHHLSRSEHRAFAIDKEPASDQKSKRVTKKVPTAIEGKELVSSAKDNVTREKQDENDESIRIISEKSPERADTADTAFEKEAPRENNLESDERVIAMWKKQREIYRQRRDTKNDTSEYRTSKRFTEIRRLKTTGKFRYQVLRVLAYPWSKRSLKQKLTFIHDQPQARIDHLQAKEERKSNTKSSLNKFVRSWLRRRPYDRRIKRLRGKSGKEQGSWKAWMEMKKEYQRRIDDLYLDQVTNDLPFQRIQHDIKAMFGEEKTSEAVSARRAFLNYRGEYRKNTEKMTKDQISVLKSDLTEELHTLEHRMLKKIKKISWNDIASIGSAPVTITGTVLTILPYAGVAV